MSNPSFLSTVTNSYWERWYEACYEEMHESASNAKGETFIYMNTMFYCWIYVEKGTIDVRHDSSFHGWFLGCHVKATDKHSPCLYHLIDVGALY